MQTFLPYADFDASARVLDMKRLGKQRVEVLQILKALSDPMYGWQNHPATKMWRDYEGALVFYGVCICQEWRNRGYKDTCGNKIRNLFLDNPAWNLIPDPPWLGDENFHASHRSNLLRKAPEWYSQFGWAELDNLPYIWPVE